MAPSTRVVALALQAAQRSALLAHIDSTAASISKLSSVTAANALSTSSLSTAIYLSASNSLPTKAASPAKAVYEGGDTSSASYLALKAGKFPAKKTAALAHADLPSNEAVSVTEILKEELVLAGGESKKDAKLLTD